MSKMYWPEHGYGLGIADDDPAYRAFVEAAAKDLALLSGALLRAKAPRALFRLKMQGRFSGYIELSASGGSGDYSPSSSVPRAK